MISWMQHHKKYLIITIWVSVIAFVGAGFVGWGSYNMNPSKADAVAMVGDEKIGLEEFNAKYANLYNNYRLMDKNFSQEQAKLMGLQGLVLNDLIVEKLFISYAKSLGLSVSDDEMLAKIASQKVFYSDGTFSKKLYYSVLKNNGYTPNVYEKMLKDELLNAKLFQALHLEVSPMEIAMLSSTTSMKDQLKIALVEVKDTELKVDEKELKNLWEKTKQNYKSKKSYVLETFFYKAPQIKDEAKLKAYYEKHKLDYAKVNGELKSYEEARASVALDAALDAAKLDADRKYVELKKKNAKLGREVTVLAGDKNYPAAIATLQKDQFLKPFVKNDGYMIVKLQKINPVQVLDFEAAKLTLMQVYLDAKRQELLKTKAKEMLKNGFDGIYTGFVDKASPKPGDISFLTQDEFSIFLSKLFSKNELNSFILFPNKAVVYKILDQKLPIPGKMDANLPKGYEKYLVKNAKDLKENILKSELINSLRKQFKIVKYYKGV